QPRQHHRRQPLRHPCERLPHGANSRSTPRARLGVASPWRGEGGAPSLSPATADSPACTTEGLSDLGAPGGGVPTAMSPPPGTPSDLARLLTTELSVTMGELSPWRSVLPPPGGGGERGASCPSHALA